MSCTKEEFYILMGIGLMLTREVKVDIRLFVSKEAKECLERDILSVLTHNSSAFGTVPDRHVKAGTILTGVIKFNKVAVRTSVMRRQRINFGNTAHRSNKR